MTLFDIARLTSEVEHQQKLINEPAFWNDQKEAVKVINVFNDLKETLDQYHVVELALNNAKELLDLDESSEDTSLLEEIYQDLISAQKVAEQLKLKLAGLQRIILTQSRKG